MPQRERLTPEGTAPDKVRGPVTHTPTTNTEVDSHAALPPGTLRGPFLGRQGDEHRQPSAKERHELEKIQAAQQEGDKR
jgi:hypothetical protein